MPAHRTDTTRPALLGKTSFDDIYDSPDPRSYFRTLDPLDYQIPHHANAVFRTLLDKRGNTGGAVVDLCCSYGINATLLNHDLTLHELYARYCAEPAAGLSPTELLATDREFFRRARRRSGVVRSVGIDAAANAVSYAVDAGMLDEGFAENLELAAPSSALRAAVADTQLITVTGGVGYIGAQTFERLLDCMPRPAWVAAFVLRTVPYQEIADGLRRFGLVTEKVTTRTFLQRRFSDAEEQRHALEDLAYLGTSPEGKEMTGFYHTELYVSRPAADIAEMPLAELLPFTTS
ncbi:class I SAM-dependent methyltransferase [Amycolatopsis sp. H20-H5]|uniref:class I SAM-dependent methyltransferase n=1 Tax=Amycolatopsis sp. H20-H5 TaxID=3046309 RepID=UPI002DBC4C9E|nr:class I SAM-dependent methyltransferase [Amycolatopsis sp. H20-H5]MEC3981943.1 class I SAM-dependent methyltransferase [Amycolatopsis sp. H20-H5]